MRQPIQFKLDGGWYGDLSELATQNFKPVNDRQVRPKMVPSRLRAIASSTVARTS